MLHLPHTVLRHGLSARSSPATLHDLPKTLSLTLAITAHRRGRSNLGKAGDLSFILRPSLPSEACLFAWSCYTIAVRCAIAFLPVCNSLSPLTLPNSSHSPVPERERH